MHLKNHHIHLVTAQGLDWHVGKFALERILNARTIILFNIITLCGTFNSVLSLFRKCELAFVNAGQYEMLLLQARLVRTDFRCIFIKTVKEVSELKNHGIAKHRQRTFRTT